jgi:amino acid transporter
MSEHGTATAPQPRQKLPRQFVAGSWLLVLTILVCGFFAGLAGKKVGGHDHAFFIVAFIFLGIVVVEIFALAFADMSTRGPDSGERFHH